MVSARRITMSVIVGYKIAAIYTGFGVYFNVVILKIL